MSDPYDYGNTMAKAASRAGGHRFNDLYKLCENQKTVSTRKLMRMVDELAESDRLDAIHFRAQADRIEQRYSRAIRPGTISWHTTERNSSQTG